MMERGIVRAGFLASSPSDVELSKPENRRPQNNRAEHAAGTRPSSLNCANSTRNPCVPKRPRPAPGSTTGDPFKEQHRFGGELDISKGHIPGQNRPNAKSGTLDFQSEVCQQHLRKDRKAAQSRHAREIASTKPQPLRAPAVGPSRAQCTCKAILAKQNDVQIG